MTEETKKPAEAPEEQETPLEETVTQEAEAEPKKKKFTDKLKFGSEKLQAELDAEKAKYAELDDKYKRTLAEYQNFRTRSQREKEGTYSDAVAATIAAFHLGLSVGGASVGSTMAFATLCLSRLFHGFNCRGKESIFRLGFRSNMASIGAFVVGFLLLNAVLLIPALHSLFMVAPLTVGNLLTVYGLAFAPTVLIQLYKILKESR